MYAILKEKKSGTCFLMPCDDSTTPLFVGSKKECKQWAKAHGYTVI